MKIRLIQVPYDSGHRDYRAGLGPGYLMQGGAEKLLADAGHAVRSARVEAAEQPTTEIRTGFELLGGLAGEVREAAQAGELPIVLAGNCNSAVGGISGLGDAPIGLIWFDAHGDFNTPETTGSGFLDGMGLAMAVGRCWRGMMAGAGLRTIPEEHAMLVGARDLDDAEEVALEASGVSWMRVEAIRAYGVDAAMGQALGILSSRFERVYVHIDMDVVDASVARINRLSATGGLTLDQLEGCIRIIGERLEVVGAGLASVEPAFEKGGRTLDACLRTLQALAATPRP